MDNQTSVEDENLSSESDDNFVNTEVCPVCSKTCLSPK